MGKLIIQTPFHWKLFVFLLRRTCQAHQIELSWFLKGSLRLRWITLGSIALQKVLVGSLFEKRPLRVFSGGTNKELLKVN